MKSATPQHAAAGKQTGPRAKTKPPLAKPQAPQPLSLTVPGTPEVFLLPPELKAIHAKLVGSLPLLDYEESWDDDGAEAFTPEVFVNMFRFLVGYANEIFDTYGKVLATPAIGPFGNGSLDVSWRTPTTRFLVNIRTYKDNYKAYFYGDLRDQEEMPIEGNVPVAPIQDHLLAWMRHYLTS